MANLWFIQIALINSFLLLVNCEYRMSLKYVFDEFTRHNGYYLPIKIGTPEKSFNVLLDTVTPLLWVPGSECGHDFCDGKAQYSHLLSRTCRTVIPHRRYSFYTYERQILAYEYDDDITIDQISGQPLKIINTVFWTPSILRWGDATRYRLVDGVLGLSSLNINDFLHDNPIHNVLRSPSIDPIITIALPPRSSYMTPTLTLGASDDKLCSTSDKQVTEKLVSLTNRYDFAYSSISIGNTTFSFRWRLAFAYIHTIKPYIAVPDLIMQELILKYDAKKDPNSNSDMYWVDCKQAFDPFYLRTANNTYVVDPSNFVIKHDYSDRKCELAFRTRQGSIGPVVLGIPFLHQYCAILRPNTRSISFRPMNTFHPNVTCYDSYLRMFSNQRI